MGSLPTSATSGVAVARCEGTGEADPCRAGLEPSRWRWSSGEGVLMRYFSVSGRTRFAAMLSFSHSSVAILLSF